MSEENSAPERITHPTALVMSAFLENPDAELYGFEISSLTGLQPGTMYPILKRQTARGRLAERLETGDARESGRPLRRYYRLTAEGVDFAGRIQIKLPSFRDREERTHDLAVDRLVRHLKTQDPAVIDEALRVLRPAEVDF